MNSFQIKRTIEYLHSQRADQESIKGEAETRLFKTIKAGFRPEDALASLAGEITDLEKEIAYDAPKLRTLKAVYLSMKFLCEMCRLHLARLKEQRRNDRRLKSKTDKKKGGHILTRAQLRIRAKKRNKARGEARKRIWKENHIVTENDKN